ncbi:MAG: carboxypeptidase regulatory-like domain-containing protein [Bryobacteraceae bacterium]
MKTSNPLFALFLSFVLLGILSPGPASAQELRGSVRGAVTDSSSAVVVGARVALRNVGTAVETVQETNTAGQYVFDFVSPGTYTITVALEGFRSFIQENILVQTRGDVTVNARLEVGAVTETVKVTESPVAVQFNRTTMETTLDTKMSNSLPIIHRNPFLLLTIDPQVVFAGGSAEQSPYHHWAAARVDVGGATQLKNDVLVDGSPNTWGPKTNYVPPMDAVSEVNVQQNATDAEYGHSAGGVISMQMKSGTNEWHGTAYYFGRNPKLNALADRITRSPNVVRHNVWGATSANPIVKNKVFNFVSYEGQNLREPVNQIVSLPTALERQGDFSQSFNILGAQRTIYDPYTTQFNRASNTSTRTPFPNNIIPGSRIDPVSARFLQDIWEPNGPGDDITRVRNYKNTFPRVYEFYNFTDRVDWNVNDQWKVFGRFSRMHTNVTSPNPSGSPAGSTGGSERNSLTAAGDAVWTVSPRVIFNVRGSYNKPVDRFIDPVAEVEDYGAFWPGNNWYEPYAKTLPANYYPGINVGGSGFGRASWWYSAPDFWNLQSKVSMQMGRHYVKAGGEFRRFRGNSGFFQPVDFRFSPAHTADTFINPDTRQRGDAWASMLLGVLDSDTRIRTSPLYAARNSFYGAYIQDDFKVNQNVTINIGVRYEYDSPIVDTTDRLSRFLDLNSPIAEFQGANAPQLPGQVLAVNPNAPAWNGSWIFTDSSNRAAYKSPRFAFMPRFGIAYRLNDRSSLRFGYSRYVIPPSVADTGGINLNDTIPYPGYENESFPLQILEGIPQTRFSDPFPAGVNPLNAPTEKRFGRYTNLGTTANSSWFFQDLKNAWNDRINVSYQAQIFSQIVVDATYFVSIGTDHYYQQQLNNRDPRFDYQHQSAVNQRVANPFLNILPEEQFPGALRTQPTVTVGDLLKPYPQYGQLTQLHTPGVHRRYQAIQLKAQRPFVNGFNFLIGYNYHRTGADEFFDIQDHFDNNLTFQDAPDPRHKFNIAGIYDLPFGRGRKFAAGLNPVLDTVLGGWTASGIYTYISGRYLRFGTMQVSGDPKLDNPTQSQWFDISKFSIQPAFTRRTNPLQMPGVTGPRISAVDMTLAKTHPITERVGLEIRLEAYNLFNNFVGADPNLTVTNAQFGRVNAQRATFFGRQIQYNARIRW